ncbi:MAG: multi-sensor signal transduction multi-kinase nodulation NodV-like protein [Candidatus Eremiobacteraeota bacterium]|jgi:signal transduction histidine kinase|nr:multi-sensor signal transduction multi-kinase nodulation NodV-like protein [Candidatus Eremiobacteraeota bacterium]
MRSLESITPPFVAVNGALRGYWRSVVQFLFGCAALALLTFVSVRLDLNLATALCLYLIVIIMMSFWGSFVSSAVVSLIAVVLLDYYFTPPMFTFQIKDPFDSVAMVLFLTTSAVITTLVSRARIRTDQLVLEANLRAEEALRQAQAELAHANRVMLVGEMTASIAHEINQPLTGVVANAGTCLRYLAAQTPNVEEARTYLGFIARDGKRAAEVIRRIRALVKKMPPRKDLLDMNEAIREVIALTQNELQRSSVTLHARLSVGLPLIPADRTQLQQVILNLIVNAVEAMNEVGDRPRELAVSTGTESNDVFVEVRDSGPGIDPANLDSLFKSFFTTKSEGMGMGLSISRSIIEAHGGRLWAMPNEPHGVVFRFTLPNEADHGADHEGLLG